MHVKSVGALLLLVIIDSAASSQRDFSRTPSGCREVTVATVDVFGVSEGDRAEALTQLGIRERSKQHVDARLLRRRLDKINKYQAIEIFLWPAPGVPLNSCVIHVFVDLVDKRSPTPPSLKPAPVERIALPRSAIHLFREHERAFEHLLRYLQRTE